MFVFSKMFPPQDFIKVHSGQIVRAWLVGQPAFVKSVKELIHKEIMPSSKAKDWELEKLVYEGLYARENEYVVDEGFLTHEGVFIEVVAALLNKTGVFDCVFVDAAIMTKPQINALRNFFVSSMGQDRHHFFIGSETNNVLFYKRV